MFRYVRSLSTKPTAEIHQIMVRSRPITMVRSRPITMVRSRPISCTQKTLKLPLCTTPHPQRTIFRILFSSPCQSPLKAQAGVDTFYVQAVKIMTGSSVIGCRLGWLLCRNPNRRWANLSGCILGRGAVKVDRPDQTCLSGK